MIINVAHTDFLHFEIFDVLNKYSTVMAHCTQLCTTKTIFYSQQIKNSFLGITVFDTFSLLFQKEKNLMSLFLIACNRRLNYSVYDS